MLVGEAPGADEDSQGRPFVGQAGRILDDCLLNADIDPKSVYITNAVKCRPPGNRDPSPSELAACIRYLIEEINTVQPKVIVCVGRWALKALTGEDTISRARGRLLDPLPKLHLGDVKLVAMTHPAAYLHQRRNQAVLDSIVEDLKAAKRIVKPVTTKHHRWLVDGRETDVVLAALAKLDGAPQLACDLEWLMIPGKESVSWPWTPGVALLSIALSGRVGGVLRSVAMSWPLSDGAKDALRTILYETPLLFHNASADVIWLLSEGFDPYVAGDTMLRSYLLDESRRAGLKGLAPLTAGVEAGWETKPWHRRPASVQGWGELLEYNAGDTENTLLTDEAFDRQIADLDSERAANLERVYRKHLIPAVKPFARMALVGTPINESALKQEITKHQKQRDKAIAELAEITGLRRDVAERLAGSAQQITRYAREAYGLEIETSRAEDLSDYVAQYPALKAIQEFKHERKMLSTYLEPWQRLLNNQGDGRLHSIYLLGATRTGRLSAELEEGGSLLLTPRDDWMRDLIAAPNDEWEILAADYSQIELRIIAWLAPERTMRRLYREGADLHATTAAYVKAKLPIARFWPKRARLVDQVTKEERQRAKGINFGFCFGMQEEKFVAYAKNNYGAIFSPQQAHEARDGYFNLYADLNTWHNQKALADYDRGYTLTPFGRYRFDLPDPTKAINTPIQSTANDLAILALTVIDERIQRYARGDAFLIGFIHDAVLVLSRKSKRKLVTRIIKESMEWPKINRVGIDNIPVPLVAEVKHGESWAKAQ